MFFVLSRQRCGVETTRSLTALVSLLKSKKWLQSMIIIIIINKNMCVRYACTCKTRAHSLRCPLPAYPMDMSSSFREYRLNLNTIGRAKLTHAMRISPALTPDTPFGPKQRLNNAASELWRVANARRSCGAVSGWKNSGSHSGATFPDVHRGGFHSKGLSGHNTGVMAVAYFLLSNSIVSLTCTSLDDS